MYNLPEYKEQDVEKIQAFMKANPFIVICGADANNKPVATHIPVLVRQEADGRIYLMGHMMKGTDHYKAFLQNPAVLGIFNGAQTYVSASWYTNKQQGSTWNYMTVHAKGTLQFLGVEELHDILRDTTAHFENNPSSPSQFEHLPDEYIQKLVKAIAGFRMDISQIDHVFKLSQDRDEKSFENIIEKLDEGNQQSKQIAAEMKTRQSDTFPK